MTGRWRVSLVGRLHVNTILHASVMQIGDNNSTVLSDRTIAVQRAIPDYHGDETRFASYSIFFRPILAPLGLPDSLLAAQNPPAADIRVGCVDVVSISASSLLRIGCGETLEAHSRIKHIRHFNNLGTLGIR